MGTPTDPEVSTADLVKRRLVGLLVLLATVFALSVLLRSLGAPATDDSGLQTVVVPLGSGESLTTETATALAAPEPESEAVTDAPARETVPSVAVAEEAEQAATTSAQSPPGKLPAPPKPVIAPAAAVAPKESKKPVAADNESAKKQRWFITLGSFSDAANAKALAQRAKAAGFSAEIGRVQSGGNTLNRVRIGPFKSESEAQSARATLIVEGLTGAKLQKEP
ncbi:SPOR domain-containing protein [Stagnimonas aquatica]|uniref:SPOR domain-containing protein n=1 Tax=Stagnimonas aquatica TaxID=2689987 RepID=A0A3N0UZ59_9GAMM|nr:SPOR domain-containing protein [Stagnimonas aquatica]ROH85642.1 SPOR domain-containing protein [Stagnimonas aquatica]